MTREDKLIIALLFATTLLIFARTSQFDFVYYDDQDYVFANPRTLAGLTLDNVRWAFTTFTLSNWHPLTWLSYMADVTVFRGARPGAMHLVNAVIHSANGVLLFILLQTMTGSRWRSALVAALFALHPLHVESVAWISERKDVLSTLFGLLAMLAYARYARTGSIIAYCLMVILFAFSLLSKPMLVTLPFLLLVLDFWPLRRLENGAHIGRLLIEKLPLLALTIASCWITMIAQETALVIVPLQVRLINSAMSYVRYLVDMIWPTSLAVLYPLARVHSQLQGLLASAFLLSVTAISLRYFRRYPHLLAGWLWYVGTLVPVIGIVAIGELARADRYTYFPLVGIFIMITWSVPTPKTKSGVVAMRAAAAVVLAALSILTWRQAGVWRNSQTLFAHALSVVGPQATLYQNYGTALSAAGENERAIALYREALLLRPNWSKPLNNMGYSLMQLGRMPEAMECYRAVIAVDPKHARAHIMLGSILMREGYLAESELLLREAVRLAPDRADARRLLNDALQRQGKPTE